MRHDLASGRQHEPLHLGDDRPFGLDEPPARLLERGRRVERRRKRKADSSGCPLCGAPGWRAVNPPGPGTGRGSGAGEASERVVEQPSGGTQVRTRSMRESSRRSAMRRLRRRPRLGRDDLAAVCVQGVVGVRIPVRSGDRAVPDEGVEVRRSPRPGWPRKHLRRSRPRRSLVRSGEDPLRSRSLGAWGRSADASRSRARDRGRRRRRKPGRSGHEKLGRA